MFNEKSESIKEIAPALNKVLSEVSNLPKTKKGYGYSYTPLDDVLEAVRPILLKHSLGVTQMVGSDGGMVTIKTLLLHDSGEYLATTLTLPPTNMSGVNDVQALGASITYGRRYQLTAMFGIASEEDVDGRHEQPKKDKPTPRQAPPQAPRVNRGTPEERKANGIDKVNSLIALIPNPAEQVEYEAQLNSILEDGTTDEQIKRLGEMYKYLNEVTSGQA